MRPRHPRQHSNFVEHKLARVDAAGAQTDRTVTSTMQISITGDGDTAFVHDQGTLSAVDVISWTPRWSSSNDAAAPVLALADGGVALQRADGVLVIKDAGGVTSEMAASPMANPSQIRLGVWTGVVQSELVAQTAAPLTDAPVWFARAGVFQGGGNALSHGAQNRRSFDTIEKAAVAALEHLYPVTEWSGWEWGGRICQTSRGFEWSNFVTNTDAGSVRTLDSPELTSEQRQQLPFCRPYPTTPHVAVFHTHTASVGQRFPSGMLAGSPEPNDMKTASLNPELKFFVRTPTADPKTRQTYRYQAQLIPDGQGGTVWSALYNTFKFVNGDWEIFPPPSNP